MGILWWHHMHKNITLVSAVEKISTTGAPDSPLQAHPHEYAHKIHGIVLDLTKIVFATDEKACAKEIGYANSAYAWWQAPEKVRAQFYEILNTIEPCTNSNPYATDEKGRPLPQLMADWFCGTVHGQGIVEKVTTYLAQQSAMNKRDVDLMIGIAKTMFNPKSFINTQKFFNEALQFVQLCRKNGYKVYILSNWPTATLEPLMQKFTTFFSLCDSIVTSADLGTLLPDPAAYKAFLKKINYHHKPEHLVYIDDHKENIQSARAIGMHTIRCPLVNDTPQFKEVRTEFEKIIGETLR